MCTTVSRSVSLVPGIMSRAVICVPCPVLYPVKPNRVLCPVSCTLPRVPCPGPRPVPSHLLWPVSRHIPRAVSRILFPMSRVARPVFRAPCRTPSCIPCPVSHVPHIVSRVPCLAPCLVFRAAYRVPCRTPYRIPGLASRSPFAACCAPCPAPRVRCSVPHVSRPVPPAPYPVYRVSCVCLGLQGWRPVSTKKYGTAKRATP